MKLLRQLAAQKPCNWNQCCSCGSWWQSFCIWSDRRMYTYLVFAVFCQTVKRPLCSPCVKWIVLKDFISYIWLLYTDINNEGCFVAQGDKLVLSLMCEFIWMPIEHFCISREFHLLQSYLTRSWSTYSSAVISESFSFYLQKSWFRQLQTTNLYWISDWIRFGQTRHNEQVWDKLNLKSVLLGSNRIGER